MKRRLRKKKHRDEFTEWGQQLVITRNRKDGFDEFLDAFIEEAIEANGCCGGGCTLIGDCLKGPGEKPFSESNQGSP